MPELLRTSARSSCLASLASALAWICDRRTSYSTNWSSSRFCLHDAACVVACVAGSFGSMCRCNVYHRTILKESQDSAVRCAPQMASERVCFSDALLNQALAMHFVTSGVQQ